MRFEYLLQHTSYDPTLNAASRTSHKSKFRTVDMLELLTAESGIVSSGMMFLTIHQLLEKLLAGMIQYYTPTLLIK
jgi:hypothetical protein